MSEYQAPGVFIEEIRFGAKPIEGVGTSTAGFVGEARFGPRDTPVGPLASFADFVREFGDNNGEATYSADPSAFLRHAARAFFLEGGTRLWVVRVAGDQAGGERGRARASDFDRGLTALDPIDDVAMIAAPGSTFVGDGERRRDAWDVASLLIVHAERMRYRIAVVDAPNGADASEFADWRSRLASSYASLNYPWVKSAGPHGCDLLLPPSGFVTGIYARSDRERGVSKSPGNEIVRGAIGLERDIDDGEQSSLARSGINCVRQFPDGTIRLWGARTLTADPDWKYVNVRRYFIYLESSLASGLQWAVFEPNGERLWQNVRRAVSDFVYDEWQSGALAGRKVDEAFFVECDRTTMAQDDIDNGRVVVLVGAAILRPAEFVLIRVTIQTSHCDSRPGTSMG